MASVQRCDAVLETNSPAAAGITVATIVRNDAPSIEEEFLVFTDRDRIAETPSLRLLYWTKLRAYVLFSPIFEILHSFSCHNAQTFRIWSPFSSLV